jgi:hypothetical protein
MAYVHFIMSVLREASAVVSPVRLIAFHRVESDIFGRQSSILDHLLIFLVSIGAQ